ncbi:hypothetical protein [Nonomuraea sp. NPDC052265]|uniref:hypothetical protein n=1 Tax=Nonomuraea sp. NPDC052265 TaxID=3364374 RepID=UPI0037CAF517
MAGAAIGIEAMNGSDSVAFLPLTIAPALPVVAARQAAPATAQGCGFPQGDWAEHRIPVRSPSP